MTTLPAWTLADLYKSPNDPQITRLLRTLPKKAKRFAAAYRGRLAAGTPAKILKAVKAYESLQEQAAKPVIYAGLLFAQDASNEMHGAFLQRMHKFSAEFQNDLVFFELELMNLSSAALKKLAAALKPYANYFTKLAERSAHKLSEEQEVIGNEFALSGRLAFLRLFDQEFSHKRFNVKGKKAPLNQSEILHLLSDPARATRRAALEGVAEGLKSDLWRLAFIFNTLAGDKAGEDRRRQFPSPQAYRHMKNETDAKSIETLAAELRRSYPAVQRYYKIKARLLGIKDFSLFDRYAPLLTAEKRYSFSRARDLVTGAFSDFSSEFGSLSKEFFKRRWIDAAKRKGKRGGAFCSYVTPDLHPYIFMNYEGAIRDLFTLAHEMGHALHGCLMRKQTLLNFDSPLTIAEAASTFGEMLLFRRLKEETRDKKERTALLVHKIDNIIATVHRQISMYLFESDFHAAYSERGELSASVICDLWQRRQRELYGSAVRLTPGSEVLWSYIPHFLHTPFYVYAYSFGELLALVFYSIYSQNPASFVKSYSAFLASGASERPETALRRFGIDLKSAAVWRKGVQILNGMVGELEEIAG